MHQDPRQSAWRARHGQAPRPADEPQLLALLHALAALTPAQAAAAGAVQRVWRRHPRLGGGLFPKDMVVAAYHDLCARGRLAPDAELLRRLRLKPTRSSSGVAVVTVLTKPFPCPGECIFCPTDARMPKSYLADEPGAQRSATHDFDPFVTTRERLRALANVGHPTAKVELLILGGTWSYYPPAYQEWFVKRCLDALNERESATLTEAQARNATAPHRNVGLVVETRPDYVDAAEVQRLRRLGVTKVQLGVQSLDDRILALNRRGHTVEQTRRAIMLLRAAGFKLHAHWMPNLLGATPASDRAGYLRLWTDPGLRPDELKIYPTALVREAELVEWWERGEYRPYTDEELIALLADCKAATPPYVRINRVVRDIPAGHVVAGSTASHLRDVVQRRLRDEGRACRCIRCREVRGAPVNAVSASPQGVDAPEALEYDTTGGREAFLSVDTPEGRLAGFLRLSLPTPEATAATGIAELQGAALVREVHVYGPVVPVGAPGAASEPRKGDSAVQHSGIGGRLLQAAEARAHAAGYARIAVIAALGTRGYYERHGYAWDELYMGKAL
jgi:elongator complex protein 3